MEAAIAGTPGFALEPYDLAAARGLSASLGVSAPIAAVLVRRGYTTPEAAREFLDAGETHDPFEFDSMEEIVARILDAVAAGSPITVHGDYDVDGVCSTAILISALRDIGARCDWYLPSRLEDGYGLSAAGIERLAERGTRLLLTADCGVASPTEVALAQRLGIEVIVTDHHEPGPRLPDCTILHPRLDGYPFAELCATGVAHKLALALRERGVADAGDGLGDLDLVALATVADMVPLVGENRALVRAGLLEARRARRPGLRALMATAGVEPQRLDEGDLSFRLAPRINAAGRLGRADAGVELMLTADQARAEQIAAELEAANFERRQVERETLAGALSATRALPDGPASPALVVAGSGWHPGVVGIVASRLVDQFGRPAIVIGLDGEGGGRGSARSVPGFDLLAGLRACDQHLLRYGGHSAAAGLELAESEIDAFRASFCAHADAAIRDLAPTSSELVDAVVGGESLGLGTAEELIRLGPFGVGNPEVRLLVPSARIRDVQPMGDEGKHARFSVLSGSRRALGVAFGVNGDLSGAGEGPHDISVRLEVNHWNGAEEPRVVLRHLYPVDQGHEPPVETESACLHQARAEEWWARFDAELDAPLARPSAAGTATGPSRKLIHDHGCSSVALLADLLSAGGPVLAVAADALRRRALAQQAAPPRRFGGGAAAIVCGRCSAESARERSGRVLESGCGLVLTDWAVVAANPEIAGSFDQVVLIDPPPSASQHDRIALGAGELHLAWGPAELEFALELLALEWAPRNALAALFATLRERTPVDAEETRSRLCGRGPHPLTAEAAARRARVLAELELIAWERTGPGRALRVVSSEQTDLERSEAFVAYRSWHEEGRQFLESQRPPT